jgi:hypothetical protein
MKFEAHGDFEIWVEQNTLFASLKGTWNKEAAERFEEAFMESATALGEEWGHLVYLNDWELCDSGMFPVIQRLVDWCIENGLKRAANVYSPSTMKSEFLNKMIVEERDGFVRRVFDNAKDAANWLTECGFVTEV